jgi:hypothetical protein
MLALGGGGPMPLSLQRQGLQTFADGTVAPEYALT